VLTIIGAVCLALLLASPPVRRVLEPFTNPLGWWEGKRKARRQDGGPAAGSDSPTSDAPPSSAPTSA
jgi:hypothetical protein